MCTGKEIRECDSDWTIADANDFYKIRYSFDIDNKVTIGYIDDVHGMVISIIEDIVSSYYTGIDWIIGDYAVLTTVPKKIKAIARCHPDDVFDETIGKRIVKARINAKKKKIICRVIDEIIKSIHKLYINDLVRYKDKISRGEDVSKAVEAIVNAKQ